ncbi:hypothetical protein [Kibdelosporangium philippinense]|uniref:hypothetical protein n=1 Tax=Kibdelosporangium philippinense TaxID=211113 RepID=UPI0036201991
MSIPTNALHGNNFPDHSGGRRGSHARSLSRLGGWSLSSRPLWTPKARPPLAHPRRDPATALARPNSGRGAP